MGECSAPGSPAGIRDMSVSGTRGGRNDGRIAVLLSTTLLYYHIQYTWTVAVRTYDSRAMDCTLL